MSLVPFVENTIENNQFSKSLISNSYLIRQRFEGHSFESEIAIFA